jgi:hypothetical protein
VNDVQRVRQQDREALRWRALNATYNGKPLRVADSLILRIVRDLGDKLSIEAIREALDYLEGKDLLVVRRRAVEWDARITDEGIDVVEGNMDCPAGVARPEW